MKDHGILKSKQQKISQEEIFQKEQLFQELVQISQDSTKEPEAINLCYKALLPLVEILNPEDLLTAFDLTSKIGQFDLPLMNALAKKLIATSYIPEESLSRIIFATEVLRYQNNNLLDYFRLQITENLSDFSPQMRTEILIAFSKFDINYYGSEEKQNWSNFIRDIAADFESSIESFNIKKLSSIALAFAKIGYLDENFLNSFKRKVSEQIHQADDYDLTRVITSIAKLDFKSPEFMETALTAFENGLSDASLQSKINIMYYLSMFRKNNQIILSEEFSKKIDVFMERTISGINFSEVIVTESKNQMLGIINELKSGKGESVLPSHEIIRQWQETVKKNADLKVSKTQTRVSNYIRYILGLDIEEEKWLEETNSNVDIFLEFNSGGEHKKGLVIQVDGPKHNLLNDDRITNAATNFNTRLLQEDYEILRINYEDVASGAYRIIIQNKISEYQEFISPPKLEKRITNRFAQLLDEELDEELDITSDDLVAATIPSNPIKSKAKKGRVKEEKKEESFDEIIASFEQANKLEAESQEQIRILTNIDTLKAAIITGNLDQVNQCLDSSKRLMSGQDYKKFLENRFNRESNLISKAAELANNTISKFVSDTQARREEADKLLEQNQYSRQFFRDSNLIGHELNEYLSDSNVHNRVEIFKRIFNEAVKCDKRSSRDFLPLAVVIKDSKILRKMLNQSSISYDEDPELVNNLFIKASMADNLAAVKILLNKFPKINPNYADVGGFTALHHAAVNGFVEIAEFLLTKCKVNPNTFARQETIAEDHNITPLYAAVNCSNSFSSGNEKLQLSESRYKYIANLLLDSGADYNVRTKNGDHLFVFAIRGGCLAVINKIIADNIINIAQPIKSSFSLLHDTSPLKYAEAFGQFEVKRALEAALASKYKPKEPAALNRLEGFRFEPDASAVSPVKALDTSADELKPKTAADRYRMKLEKSRKQSATAEVPALKRNSDSSFTGAEEKRRELKSTSGKNGPDLA